MALRSMVKGVRRSCVLLALSATAHISLGPDSRVALVWGPSVVSAPAPPGYPAEGVRCIRCRVTVTTDVKTELQGRERVERVAREGVLAVRGTPADSGVAIEAWWDS